VPKRRPVDKPAYPTSTHATSIAESGEPVNISGHAIEAFPMLRSYIPSVAELAKIQHPIAEFQESHGD
jgi:hypothetical protein